MLAERSLDFYHHQRWLIALWRDELFWDADNLYFNDPFLYESIWLKQRLIYEQALLKYVK